MIVRDGGWNQDFEGHGIEPDQDAARVLRLNVKVEGCGLGDSAAILLPTIHDRRNLMSQIAREIGVTPNAVIGKMNRLGLSRPKDVIATQLEQRPAAGLARTEESKDLAPKALAPEHLRPAWDADGGVPCSAAAPEDIPIYKRVRMHAARARSGEIRT